MWKTRFFLRTVGFFYPQPLLGFSTGSPQGHFPEKIQKVFHREKFHIPQPLLITLQAGIDIRADVPDVVLGDGIALFHQHFHLADVIQYGGVVFVELLADVRQG